MNKYLKYTLISVVSVIVVLYMCFLIAPLFLTGVVNSYSGEISNIIEKSCGFKVKLDNINIVSTPKLTIGAKVGNVEVALPTGEKFLTVDNVQAKMSLIPILVRRIEADMIGADNINLNLKVKKDGKFLIEDYIPQNDDNDAGASQVLTALPYGLKLSNHLPNININNYNIAFIDIPTDKMYSIYGNNISISDFILNKKIKVPNICCMLKEDALY